MVDRARTFRVAILYSSSQNSLTFAPIGYGDLRKGWGRNPLFIKSEFSRGVFLHPVEGPPESQSFIHQVRILSPPLIIPFIVIEGFGALRSQSFIHQVRILSCTGVRASYYMPRPLRASQSFIHQVRILSMVVS